MTGKANRLRDTWQVEPTRSRRSETSFSNMFSFRTPLSALTLLALILDSSAGGGSAPSHSFDLSGSELSRIYNSPVFKAERMKRPLGGLPFVLGPISHSGVRVTLGDGSQWLVHKGGNYGVSSQTVLTSARHMSSAWTVVRTLDFQGTKMVADFVASGGSDYSLIFDNCHLGSRRMMNQ